MLVSGAGQHRRAVRAERHILDPVPMRKRRPDLFSRGGIPNPHVRAVGGRSQIRTRRMERQIECSGPVGDTGLQSGSRLHVPEFD